ncbi:hypothetical protein MPLDJ20_190115 [Mesorhizobium plurifarium]|uniref:Uncharacterized protein n=1 Tax=Mesorhizobium plurifarium TaxID=69974 RepID=A0A090ET61_MESPL|nr:hypothetical protein MPLDJ20_190115 [Mesorhizobium plurifarium]
MARRRHADGLRAHVKASESFVSKYFFSRFAAVQTPDKRLKFINSFMSYIICITEVQFCMTEYFIVQSIVPAVTAM